jgi:C1A family cysteine protease
MTNKTGWIPDERDPRDNTLSSPEISTLLFRGQAPEQLMQMIEEIVEVLEGINSLTDVPKINLFGNDLFQLKLIPEDLINAIQALAPIQQSTTDKTDPLNLVPARLVSPQDIPTQIRIEHPPSGSSDAEMLYVPVLGRQADRLNMLPPLKLPTQYLELKQYCSRVESQLDGLQSCTAHAGVALMEYFRQRQTTADETKSTFSSRFLYKVTQLLRSNRPPNESGASLRDMLKAMMLFGVPPETVWPHNPVVDDWDAEPSAFCYAYAKNYQAVKYFRLDRPDISQPTLLAQIKVSLLAGLPVIFGFRTFSHVEASSSDPTLKGMIPYPKDPIDNQQEIRGHAVMAIGYDDNQEIPGPSPGAIYFKNSWGEEWGDQGYGWLPYDYILNTTPENHLTGDWWTLLDANWAKTEQFGLRPDEKGTLLGSDRNKGKPG